MSSFLLTNQKVPEKQKDKEWYKSHILQFVAHNVKNTNSSRRQKQLECLKAYLCYVDKEGEEKNRPITAPYRFKLGLEWISYPLIESKLEQMIAEFLTRGVKKKTYVLNKDAQTKKLNDMFSTISEGILREVNKELEPSLGFVPETHEPDKELPEDEEAFFESGYKTQSEETSDTILNQVLVSKHQIDKIKDLYLDWLLYEEVIADVDEEDGHPCIIRENIFETFIDFNPDKDIQNNAQFHVKNKILSYNQIINTYDLTDEEEAILKTYINRTNNLAPYNGLEQDGYDNKIKMSDWITGTGDLMQIRCVQMRWIGYHKERVKISINKKTGKEIYKNLPEGYKARPTDNVKSIWVQDKRKCFMVGPQLVLDYGIDEQRFSTIDNPKKDTLSVTGLRKVHTLGSENMRSAAVKLLQLQEFASECLFELRLAMRRNNGRVLVYDAAQIPKQFLKDGGYSSAINRVMHHAKKDQFLIINSMDKQARYAFNQFTSLDMSTKGLMQDLFNTLALIEQLAGKFIGISPQQEGQISQYESATGTERAVAQTTVRQEIYTRPFESFLKYVFEKILIKGKYCYEESETTQYIFGDLKTKFFKIYPAYFQEDIGVYIGDNIKEQKNKQIIDQAAQMAMTNAQTPDLILNLIKVLNAETAGESEQIFIQGLKALDKLRADQQQAEADNAKAENESKEKIAQDAAQLTRDGYAKDIKVAEIYAENKAITESMKNETTKRTKAADIEKDFLLADKKESKNSK